VGSSNEQSSPREVGKLLRRDMGKIGGGRDGAFIQTKNWAGKKLRANSTIHKDLGLTKDTGREKRFMSMAHKHPRVKKGGERF